MILKNYTNEQLALYWPHVRNDRERKIIVGTLLKQNAGFIYNFTTTLPEAEDFRQSMFFAIIDALNGYDSARGFKFISYFVWLIRKHAGIHTKSVQLVKPYYGKVDGKRVPIFPDSVWLNAKVPGTSKEYIDLLSAKEDDSKSEANKYVHEIIRVLSAKHKKVVEMYYGIGDNAPRTMREIAGFFGVTHERIRQIRNEAQSIIRQKIVIEKSNNNSLYKEMESEFTTCKPR